MDKNSDGVVPDEKAPREKYGSLKVSKEGQKVEGVYKMVESGAHCYGIHIPQEQHNVSQ